MNTVEHTELQGMIPDEHRDAAHWAEREDRIDTIIAELGTHGLPVQEQLQIRNQLEHEVITVLHGHDPEGHEFTITFDINDMPELRWKQAA